MMRFVEGCARPVFAAVILSLPGYESALAQVQGMQPFENRIEGTNVHNNALQDFSLLAIHRSMQSFGHTAILHVRFFLPKTAGDLNKQMFVEASELQDSFHYFMAAKDSTKWSDGHWNVFEPWPTKDVIDRLGLQSTNLGVRAGYRIANGPPVYLPVDVYQSDGQPTVQPYTFYFITGSDLQSLDVSVTNNSGVSIKSLDVQQKCNKQFNGYCKLYAAGSTHAFTLDMSGMPEGEYHVRLLGHVPANLVPTSLEAVIYHSK